MKKCLFSIDALVVWCPTWSKNLGRCLLYILLNSFHTFEEDSKKNLQIYGISKVMKILLKLSRKKNDLNHVATAPILVSDWQIDYLFQLKKFLVKADIKQLSPKQIKKYKPYQYSIACSRVREHNWITSLMHTLTIQQFIIESVDNVLGNCRPNWNSNTPLCFAFLKFSYKIIHISDHFQKRDTLILLPSHRTLVIFLVENRNVNAILKRILTHSEAMSTNGGTHSLLWSWSIKWQGKNREGSQFETTLSLTLKVSKVRKFWEVHQNLRNLPNALDIYLVNIQSMGMRKIFFQILSVSQKVQTLNFLEIPLSKKRTKYFV